MKLLRTFFPPKVQSSLSRKRRWRPLGVRRNCLGVVHKKMTQSKPRLEFWCFSKSGNAKFRLVEIAENPRNQFSSRNQCIMVTKTLSRTPRAPRVVALGAAQKKWHNLTFGDRFLGVLKSGKARKNHQNPWKSSATQFFMKMLDLN